MMAEPCVSYQESRLKAWIRISVDRDPDTADNRVHHPLEGSEYSNSSSHCLSANVGGLDNSRPRLSVSIMVSPAVLVWVSPVRDMKEGNDRPDDLLPQPRQQAQNPQSKPARMHMKACIIEIISLFKRDPSPPDPNASVSRFIPT